MEEVAYVAGVFDASGLEIRITGDIGESHRSEECFSCLQNLFPLGVREAGVIIAAFLIAERASFLCEAFVEGDDVEEGDLFCWSCQDESAARPSSGIK